MSDFDLFKHDVRVRDRLLRKGIITEPEQNQYLAELPDMEAQCDQLALGQPALGRSETNQLTDRLTPTSPDTLVSRFQEARSTGEEPQEQPLASLGSEPEPSPPAPVAPPVSLVSPVKPAMPAPSAAESSASASVEPQVPPAREASPAPFSSAEPEIAPSAPAAAAPVEPSPPQATPPAAESPAPQPPASVAAASTPESVGTSSREEAPLDDGWENEP